MKALLLNWENACLCNWLNTFNICICEEKSAFTFQLSRELHIICATHQGLFKSYKQHHSHQQDMPFLPSTQDFADTSPKRAIYL